jgi:thiamine biosynthesis lipoprotein
MYSATNGVFNCSVGAVLEQNGYGKYADEAARTSTDLLRDISVQKDMIAIAPHVRLDFGGFGKGWLVDSLGKMLASSGCDEYIVNGGGDILAHTKKPERFALEHPYDSTLMIGEILLQDGALAASSPLKRTWKKDGKQHNHLVGSTNSADVIAGFVTAKTALYADVLSTVFLLTDAANRQALATHYRAEYLQLKTDMSAVQSPGFDAQLY